MHITSQALTSLIIGLWKLSERFRLLDQAVVATSAPPVGVIYSFWFRVQFFFIRYLTLSLVTVADLVSESHDLLFELASPVAFLWLHVLDPWIPVSLCSVYACSWSKEWSCAVIQILWQSFVVVVLLSYWIVHVPFWVRGYQSALVLSLLALGLKLPAFSIHPMFSSTKIKKLKSNVLALLNCLLLSSSNVGCSVHW